VPVSAKKAQVLVVDDEEDISEVISYNLTREGYELVCAHSGEEALKLMSEDRPDILPSGSDAPWHRWA
jgi:DNA-binding response OmpR family regulator